MINISGRCLDIDISKCKFLGKGCEGSVYLTPKGHALKIFKNKKKCQHEYDLLKKVEVSPYFPKVIKVKDRCMLREYVDGVPLDEHIKKQGLSKKLSKSLIYLIEEFKKLGFQRLDTRAKHIYVQSDESIITIDPRKCFTKKVPVPRAILKKLNKLNVIDDFIKVLLQIRPDLANKWIEVINSF